MNKALVIFIMILIVAVFLPGFSVNTSAPLCDRGGISSSSYMTPVYGEDKSAAAAETKPALQCDKSRCCCGDNVVLYKVMAITLIIWIGISAYLVFLHIKIAALEKKSNE